LAAAWGGKTAFRAVFSFPGPCVLAEPDPVNTIIYVDGYNLFYGCLKHSSGKWLDIQALLFERVVRVQDPSATLLKIKYFTAPIRAKIATHGQDATNAQQAYHRALERLYPDTIEVIKGYYSLEKANLLEFVKPPDKSKRISVWRLEEKQTDVNIALEAYRDALRTDVSQQVFVSNDSDIAPVVQAVKEDFAGKVRLGVIFPIRDPRSSNGHRPGNNSLSRYADWTRGHITDSELAESQLPARIPTKKKPICRPDYW